MKKIIILLSVIAIVAFGCSHNGERPSVPIKTSGDASATQKTAEEQISTERVIPQSKPEMPAPQISQEERERMIRETEVEAPQTK